MMEWNIKQKQPGRDDANIEQVTEIAVKLKGTDLAALFTDHIISVKVVIDKHLFEYAVMLDKRDLK